MIGTDVVVEGSSAMCSAMGNRGILVSGSGCIQGSFSGHLCGIQSICGNNTGLGNNGGGLSSSDNDVLITSC
jgi:hypothetical protein